MKPWEQCPSVWSTEPKYFSWLRGQIRKIWKNNPVRMEYIKNVRRDLTEEEKNSGRFHRSTKKVLDCNMCKRAFKGSDIQVDHIRGETGCKSIDEAKAFLVRMAYIDYSEVQILCKECHRVKTYAERYGKSLEEAKKKYGY